MNRKVLILGGPKTGKSTRAQGMGTPVLNTDHLRDRGWGEDSAEVAQWMNKPGSWVIEGTAVVRGLRKWMTQNPDARLDGVEIVALNRPYGMRSEGQERMAKGCDTIWGQIRADAVRRGARVTR